MNLDNIKKGMIIYNYKELCKLLEIEARTGGMGRKNQIDWIEDYVKYKKDGHKFIIEDVYSDLEIVPMRGRGGVVYTADYPNCKIDFDKWKDIGVYKITLDSKIYIGSTIVGFRVRFLGHAHSSNPLITKQMLDEGAIFEILQECNDMTEDEIRMLERKYIRYYSGLSEYELVNQQGFNKYKTNQPMKYKIIKKFDTKTGNMVTQYKKGHKLLYEERCKINDDKDVKKMLEFIENKKGGF